MQVGHAGTLDPMATGLLILCTGKATKAINTYVEANKAYTGTLVSAVWQAAIRDTWGFQDCVRIRKRTSERQGLLLRMSYVDGVGGRAVQLITDTHWVVICSWCCQGPLQSIASVTPVMKRHHDLWQMH